MQPFTLKTYTGAEPPRYSFFILNKGYNSGKPLRSPCANCFVLSAANDSARDFYYALCFGLWQAKAFHPYLCGSVIEFIHKKDLNDCICRAARIAEQNIPGFEKAVRQLHTIEHTEKLIAQQQQLVKEAKRAIFRAYVPR